MELDLFEELRRQPSVGAEYDEEESGVRYGWSGKQDLSLVRTRQTIGRRQSLCSKVVICSEGGSG